MKYLLYRLNMNIKNITSFFTIGALSTATWIGITKPASASPENWFPIRVGIGEVVEGGFDGGKIIASGDRIDGNQLLIRLGLTPTNCNVGVVAVIIDRREFCAIPNQRYSAGTYVVAPDLSDIYPFGGRGNNGSNGSSINPGNSGGNWGNNGGPWYPAPYLGTAVPAAVPGGFPQSGPIYRLSGQPLSPPTIARLRSLLAGNNISEAACGTTPQQVTVIVNNDFVICGHPTAQHPPGNYRFTMDGLY